LVSAASLSLVVTSVLTPAGTSQVMLLDSALLAWLGGWWMIASRPPRGFAELAAARRWGAVGGAIRCITSVNLVVGVCCLPLPLLYDRGRIGGERMDQLLLVYWGAALVVWTIGPVWVGRIVGRRAPRIGRYCRVGGGVAIGCVLVMFIPGAVALIGAYALPLYTGVLMLIVARRARWWREAAAF
jgi:hypothetical protein